MTKKRLADLEFSLVRSDVRRTGDIVVERNGQVTVRAPSHIEDEVIDKAVGRRAAWVHRTLAEWEDLNAARTQRQIVEGAGIPYLGRTYRVRLCPKSDEPLTLRRGRWHVRQEMVRDGDEAVARKAFRDYFISKGVPLLASRVEEFAPKIGVKPGRVSVRELGYRWASCGAQGAINFHWKVMMAPHTVIDYIVVHELSHLHHRDHSNAFWNEVDKVLPRYRESRDWLRRNGASFDLLDRPD